MSNLLPTFGDAVANRDRGPDFLNSVDFVIACEDGSLTDDQFDASAQAFVDSGLWRHLQGSWQRRVMDWVDNGLIEL